MFQYSFYGFFSIRIYFQEVMILVNQQPILFGSKKRNKRRYLIISAHYLFRSFFRKICFQFFLQRRSECTIQSEKISNRTQSCLSIFSLPHNTISVLIFRRITLVFYQFSGRNCNHIILTIFKSNCCSTTTCDYLIKDTIMRKVF